MQEQTCGLFSLSFRGAEIGDWPRTEYFQTWTTVLLDFNKATSSTSVGWFQAQICLSSRGKTLQHQHPIFNVKPKQVQLRCKTIF